MVDADNPSVFRESFEDKYPWSFLFDPSKLLPKLLNGYPVTKVYEIVEIGKRDLFQSPCVDCMSLYHDMGWFTPNVVNELCQFYTRYTTDISISTDYTTIKISCVDSSTVYHPKILAAACDAYLFTTSSFLTNPTAYQSIFGDVLQPWEQWHFVLIYDTLNSMVSRCIEYNLFDSLQLLIETYIPKILQHFDKYLSQFNLSFVGHIYPINQKWKLLMLRWVGSFRCYIFAKTKGGFYDPHIDLIITNLQRRVRKQNKINKQYLGPHPTDYNAYMRTILTNNTYQKIVANLNPDDILDKWHAQKASHVIGSEQTGRNIEINEQYWGYRHTWYFLRWNPTQRWLMYWLRKYFWQDEDDCRSNAMSDFDKFTINMSATIAKSPEASLAAEIL
jgi:hypothetical protein